MARAFKCDRCGKLYAEEVRSNSKLYVGKMDECYCMRPLDVCSLCMGEFETWWQSGKEGEKEKNEESEY